MRLNQPGNLLRLVMVALLVIAPLATGALAASDVPGDPHAGHDMSTMNQSDMSSANQADPNAGHDMSSVNWPVIYGFAAFNLLVIIAAALLKRHAKR